MAVNEWVVWQGLPEGEFLYELTDPRSGDAVAVFDLAWPDGLQEELSEPVALLIDEPADVHDAANRAASGSSPTSRPSAYVRQEILASEEEERRGLRYRDEQLFLAFDVFKLRDRVVGEYKDYVESFVHIYDQRIEGFVRDKLERASSGRMRSCS